MALTWYDILDILPGASAGEVRSACAAKAAVLAPELISGAPSMVVTAAGRAQACLQEAARVLLDPASRQRYDIEIGALRPGEGLERPEPVPSDPGMDLGWASRGGEAAAFAAALGALAYWLAPHPAPPRRVTMPDARGLFVGPCRHLAASLGLRLEIVRLTEHPMPVEGLVVDQSPRPGATSRRGAVLTVRVWHPAEAGPRLKLLDRGVAQHQVLDPVVAAKVDLGFGVVAAALDR
jgi:curved DNA-binding protein CbpA